MALKQHTDEKVRYDQQVDNSKTYVLPFIERSIKVESGLKVLEIGCGEGGVLVPFIEKGCTCVGVDLSCPRIDIANDLLNAEVAKGSVEFLCKNVYDEDFLERFKGYFDLIIMKDAIEHIPNQEVFIPYIKQLLSDKGVIYFGFPPWYMPFGGHQQICERKIGMMPYYHILPKPLYKSVLKLIGESEGNIKELMDIHDTQISIERFERIIKDAALKVVDKQHYLINPIYQYKFGWKPRKQLPVITAIPYLRNFLTTCVYYTVGK